MLQSDLSLRLQNFFANSSYYQGIDLNDSIQDGYDEVCAFSGCILKAAQIPFTNEVTYYDMVGLLPDYIGLVAIFNTTTRRWMWPTSIRKLNDVRIDWETCSGTPYYFCPVSHRYVAIYKKPTTDGYGNMFVYYRAAAPTLASGDKIQIPDDFALVLQDYSITDLWEQNQEFSKASFQAEAYQKTLEELRVWVHNQRNPERMQSLKG